MKITIVLFFLTTLLLASPKWFHNLPSKSYEIVAYGIDENLQVARNIAKAEVSEIIKINISSNTKIVTTDINGEFTKSYKNDLLASTKAILQGVLIVKEEYMDNRWYVAVKYDNRSLLQKIRTKYPKYDKSKLENINKVDLVRKNSAWYIKIKNDLYFFSREDFKHLFSNINNNKLIFKSNKMIYLSGEKIVFSIKSKYSGYVSILYSEESGKVGVVLPNSKIKDTLTYPSTNNAQELIMYNPTNSTLTEFYICLYSKNKLDLREFEIISDDLLDESNYNFHNLVDMIKKHSYSTIKIKIKQKKLKLYP